LIRASKRGCGNVAGPLMMRPSSSANVEPCHRQVTLTHIECRRYGPRSDGHVRHHGVQRVTEHRAAQHILQRKTRFCEQGGNDGLHAFGE